MDLTWDEVYDRIGKMQLPSHRPYPFGDGERIWGIPRGGAVVAGVMHGMGHHVVSSPREATVAVDDIKDSGATAQVVHEKYGLSTVALIDKGKEEIDGWVHFPWEEPSPVDIGESMRRVIEYLGDDPTREGLLKTPQRVVKSWDTLYAGYGADASDHLVWFEDDTDEMIISRNIQFYSTCEHHMLPFFGTAAVGYIPRGHVIGISKLSRIVNVFARRLQTQERLTKQIGEALEPHVRGVAVHLEGQHLCMMARGVAQQDSTMITNYLTGPFFDLPEARAEFLNGAG
jgi:GTP cyclohydrolase I